MSTVISKIGPPSKISPSSFFEWSYCKGTLLSKVHWPIYAAVHAVMLSKKQQRNSTVQEEGLTNEGRHHLHKQVDDKRGIAESLQANTNGARQTACEMWGGHIFDRNITTHPTLWVHRPWAYFQEVTVIYWPIGLKFWQELRDSSSTAFPSLVTSLRAPSGRKQFGERSRIPWAYSTKVAMTNEIARWAIIT